ncbi:MAG TPA: glycosyltransferase [Desulfobacteria bacterium]|nr:glycosyltransferase [Desulfobacteria bacterium]
MGRLKVLHVIGGGEFGGAEQHLLSLLRHIDKHEFELHVACLFTEPLAPMIVHEGFKVYILPMRNKIDLKPVGRLASLISSEGFHIIHTHGVRANMIGRLAARKAGAGRVVTTVHSVLAFDYNRWLDRWVNRICEAATKNMTEHFITVSEMLARQMINEGMPAGKVTPIHNGLEIENYDPCLSGDQVRNELGIGRDKLVLGIVARLHPVKGHCFLLEALAKVITRIPEIILVIVGTGPERSGLESMVSGLGISKNVIFAGFRRDIPQVIAAVDFMVLPSLSEGLSLTIMEGMAMKKPVISTCVGGTPEIITTGLDGMLVPPADIPALARCIEELALNPEESSKLGIQARKTIENRFTAALMAAKTAKLYKDMVKEGNL